MNSKIRFLLPYDTVTVENELTFMYQVQTHFIIFIHDLFGVKIILNETFSAAEAVPLCITNDLLSLVITM